MKNMQKTISNSELEVMPQPLVGQAKTAGNVVGRTNLIINCNFNLAAIWFVFIAKSILYTVTTKLPSSARFITLRTNFVLAAKSERGDVPGWVLVVLMTTGLVTGIWTVAQPRLSSILKNSLDNMNSIR